MGVSRYLKERNPGVTIVGLQPSEGSSIAGIRRWPQEYLPKIFDVSLIPESSCDGTERRSLGKKDLGKSNSRSQELCLQETRVDTVLEISEREADETMRALAKVEGIFAGRSSVQYYCGAICTILPNKSLDLKGWPRKWNATVDPSPCFSSAAGVSSGGAVSAAIRLSSRVNNATICVIVCDRGDRYLSSGMLSIRIYVQRSSAVSPE